MNCSQTVFAILFVVAASAGGSADERTVRAGLYEIDYSLELPHLERYAIVRTATVCVNLPKRRGRLPLPVLSVNKTFDKCSIQNVQRGESKLTYDIVCDGRASARASATYQLKQDRFRGRVAMVLGAKNMTMTEVQYGRRLGSCRVASH